MALYILSGIRKGFLAAAAISAMAMAQLGCGSADLESRLAPEPLPTATPRDFLGLSKNKLMRVANISQVQDIIDYYERMLIGRRFVGHKVPVVFVEGREEWRRLFEAPPHSPYGIDPERQAAFLMGAGENYSIYIRSGRSLWEVVAYLCTESGGAYYTDEWLRTPGMEKDRLIDEVSGIVFSGACLSVLRGAGYDMSVSRTPENEEVARSIISSLSSETSYRWGTFRDVILTAWAAADELGFIAEIERSPVKRLNPRKQMGLYKHVIAHDSQYFAPRIRRLAQDEAKMKAIENIVVERLVPGLPVRVNEELLMEREALYMPVLLYSP